MSIARASEGINELAREISKSHKVKEITTGVAPQIIGATVTAVTANPAVGTAANVAATTWARSHAESFTQVAVSAGLSVAFTALSVVATPLLLGFLAYEGVKHVFRSGEEGK